jgi:hypothetical protein
MLFPFKHRLFFGVLFGLYGLFPLQEIHETVESPISVYWQDDVWPGFDEYGRSWMVKSYLDGIHLKALALNGDDGKIYLYRAIESSRAESRSIDNNSEVKELEESIEALMQKGRDSHARTGKKDMEVSADIEKARRRISEIRSNYGQVTKEEIQRIIDGAAVYNSALELPAMNYSVLFKPIHQWFPLTKMYHADLITITDTRNAKIIAFSIRYMAYAPWIAKISGEQPKFGEKTGDIRAFEFDDKVLFGYSKPSGYDSTRDWELNKRLGTK